MIYGNMVMLKPVVIVDLVSPPVMVLVDASVNVLVSDPPTLPEVNMAFQLIPN
ncbi:hypothetical protein [uncultured Cedecea sp.]|uniref:hypothetical protein n=1 Tax=uncultured Cedecea sp. TaxID=988762 RepID=UPI00260EF293|nr:hypothetical protein [uncultured Cedecea sp.]